MKTNKNYILVNHCSMPFCFQSQALLCFQTTNSGKRTWVTHQHAQQYPGYYQVYGSLVLRIVVLQLHVFYDIIVPGIIFYTIRRRVWKMHDEVVAQGYLVVMLSLPIKTTASQLSAHETNGRDGLYVRVVVQTILATMVLFFHFF